jgi:hypothetical protein
VETHRELCAVYGRNVTSEETVRQWCRILTDRRTVVNYEERSSRPSVANEVLVQSVDQKFENINNIFKFEFRVTPTNLHRTLLQ